ncbi:MAG: stealth conserved region 3 domain-containing protein [Nocardioides sp.]|uniref:stealth conserved region 3 domain-containing protein n=1 Tax=Nocardioides sp. TaxID=35761 RepID=UPI003F0D89AC
MGGTSRSVITQANALARRGNVDVRLVSVTRQAETPHYAIDAGIRVDHLADVRDEPAAHSEPSRLVPHSWDWQYSAHTDAAVAAYLPTLDVDVLVTVTPALMALAVQWCPPTVRVVHQEHRSSADRAGGLTPLLAYAPRVATVAMLTRVQADWLAAQLGPLAPEIVVVPNALPLAPQPPADPSARSFVAAGRVAGEKQFHHLVAAFTQVAERLPEWRLRILGDGPAAAELAEVVRRSPYADRIELAGAVDDMRPEWAAAGVCLLSSRTEGLPLVVQEAMSAGVPVISYDCPSGPRELVTHEESGLLVTPQSIDSMASAMLRVGSDDELRARLGAGALAASAAYDADEIAQRWERILTRAALGGEPPKPRRAFSRAGGPVADGTPQDVRAEVLRLVLAGAGDEAFVLPAAEAPLVVVPHERQGALLDHLAEQAPAHLSILDPGQNGWAERRDTVARMATTLRNTAPGRLLVEPWPRHAGRRTHLSAGAGVAVEFWDTALDGSLVAPDWNAWTRTVPPGTPRGTLEVAGVEVPTLAWTSLPTSTDAPAPVDVVYTWVDGSDPVWDAARRQRRGDDEAPTPSGDLRYRNFDELRYSLRSLHLFAPWVRQIHVVTAGQRPAWLRDHPKVRLVDHRDILPADALPTFNSHAIETALHRIDGLAEHFIYFNDDIMLGRPLAPETFFGPGGSPAVFLSPSSLLGVPGAAVMPYELAAANNRRLLTDAFGVTTGPMVGHTPYPHRVSVLREIEERFPAELAATARAPFRSGTDVSLLSNLAQHYGLATGRAHVAEAEWSFVTMGAANVERRLKRLMRRDQDFFCLGDHADNDVELTARVLPEFCEAYFPVHAPWED